jgi:Zinc-finger associated domain (zf-AD)
MDIPRPLEANQIISIEFMGKSMLFDSNNFCRCCLAADESLVPMANPGTINQADGSTLQSLYDSVCSLTIHFPGQPQICESCVFDLRMAVQFHQMCKQANAKLKEIFQGGITIEPVKVKEEPEEQELFIADSQIEATTEMRAEVKTEPELNIIDHMADGYCHQVDYKPTADIKTEGELNINGILNELRIEGMNLYGFVCCEFQFAFLSLR